MREAHLVISYWLNVIGVGDDPCGIGYQLRVIGYWGPDLRSQLFVISE
jgi:hypothetical protein